MQRRLIQCSGGSDKQGARWQQALCLSEEIQLGRRASGGRRPWNCGMLDKMCASSCSPTRPPTTPQSALGRRASGGRRPWNCGRLDEMCTSSCSPTRPPTAPQSARVRRASGGRRPWNCGMKCARPAAARRYRLQYHIQRLCAGPAGAEGPGIGGENACVQLQPDATAYIATFSACAQGQRWQKALD